MDQVVGIAWLLAGIYLLAGLVFSVPFVLRGAAAIDPTARDGASWGFRLCILPGTVVFWPLLAKRWFGGATEPPEEKSPHRCAACRAPCADPEKGS